jgi:L-methionine (R)-S-oxide reductase
MSESLITTQGTKQEQYATILPQIKALIEGESDLIANMANVCAALKEQFNWLWIGFYLVKNDQLVLGPFQGPIACTRINYNKGVCGTAWAMRKTILVADVDKFPGHIACSSLSKSEIVIPLIQNNKVIAVLDIDSVELDSFDLVDKNNLEKMITYLLL